MLLNSVSLVVLLLITLLTVLDQRDLLRVTQAAGAVLFGLGMQRSFEAAASLPAEERTRQVAFRVMGGMLAFAALVTAASGLGVIDGFRP